MKVNAVVSQHNNINRSCPGRGRGAAKDTGRDWVIKLNFVVAGRFWRRTSRVIRWLCQNRRKQSLQRHLSRCWK